MITTSNSCKWEQVAADLQAPAAPSHRLLPSSTAQQQHLRCPRCDSTNTKFCYYNNYSLSQPRHFCKACKRYWTRGGTLRNVPVGGGCRKNKRVKRLGTSSSPSAVGPSSSSSSNSSTSSLLLPTTATCSGGQTMALPTSSNLNPFLYTHSLRIPSHEFESVLGNPNVAANEFQPRPPPQPQHSTLPTRSTLLQNYPFLGPPFVSSSSSSYPSSPREINATNPSSSPSPSSLLPFYLHGLQAGVYAGDANLCLLKQETGVLELQPTSSENQLEPWASSAVNPLWTSPISTAWTTEPTSTTMFGSSSTTPLI